MSKNKNHNSNLAFKPPVAPPVQEQAPVAPPVQEQAPDEANKVLPRVMPKFIIKHGRSVVCKRGIISEGGEITVSDVYDDLNSLKSLYERGIIEVVE